MVTMTFDTTFSKPTGDQMQVLVMPEAKPIV